MLTCRDLASIMGREIAKNMVSKKETEIHRGVKDWGFLKLGVPPLGVLILRSFPFEIYIGVPLFCELPYQGPCLNIASPVSAWC